MGIKNGVPPVIYNLVFYIKLNIILVILWRINE